jgi:hypothetical protein
MMYFGALYILLIMQPTKRNLLCPSFAGHQERCDQEEHRGGQQWHSHWKPGETLHHALWFSRYLSHSNGSNYV